MSEIDLYEQLAERHGHYCPMSTLGLRLGLEMVQRLSAAGAGTWKLCYQMQTCAADGIAMALENSLLTAELHIEPQGQHLLLCAADDGRELSLALSDEAMLLAGQYRELSDEEKPQHLELLRHIAVERIID